jgi:hypothetical protein
MKTGIGALALAALLAGGLPGTTPRAAAQMAASGYEITVTNLTEAQIFSPPLLASHKPTVQVWRVGEPSSDGVWMVAESGNSGLLAEALAGMATDVQRTGMPVLPGQRVTVRIAAEQGDVLSLVAMLAETNDGFVGLAGVPLQPGAVEALAYDAGTEENTESAMHVPGPPYGGMGHVATSPPQPIAPHPGILGVGDVAPQFGWSGPVARVEISAVTAGR